MWETNVEPGPLILKDLRGGYGATTPCTDGQRVYALFGPRQSRRSTWMAKLLWSKELADYAFDVALGSSPIIHNDSVSLD